MIKSQTLILVFFLVFSNIAFAQEDVQPLDNDSIYTFETGVLHVFEKTEIPATAVGPLREVNIQQGEIIEPGKVMANVDDTLARNRLQDALVELKIVTAQSKSQVDLEFARSSREVAVADLRRAKESNSKYAGVVSDREMDRLRLLVQQGDSELKKLKFDKDILKMQAKRKQVAVDKFKYELDRHAIRAETTGQVSEILKRKGEWVNLADTIFEIARLDRLRVEEYLPADIATSQLLNCKTRFSINVAGEEQTLANGKVVFVSPEINPLNSTVLVWIEFKNTDLKLRPGMKGKVTIAEPDTASKASASNK